MIHHPVSTVHAKFMPSLCQVYAKSQIQQLLSWIVKGYAAERNEYFCVALSWFVSNQVFAQKVSLHLYLLKAGFLQPFH